eukprot:m.2812 g.2812  ORF g.2812 m.2812 type:complete len:208 (+) comp8916_c0_seq1:133-756(+)
MPTYKLTYFTGRGRAEIIRLILAQGGVEYEDERIPGDKWPELKPKTPTGCLPFMTVDGAMISESQALAAFVAEVAGLHGDTPLNKARAHMVAEATNVVFNKMVENHFIKDETKKAEEGKKLKEETMPGFMGRMEKILVANEGGDGWIVGSSVTYADIVLLNLFNTISLYGDSAFAKGDAPKLAALVKKVEALPNIKKWLENRPESSF